MYLDALYHSTASLQNLYVQGRRSNISIEIKIPGTVGNDNDNDDSFYVKCTERTYSLTIFLFERLSGITILLHLVDGVLTQSIRGCVHLLVGISTFHQGMIVSGCRDLLAVLVQSVVMPVLALISTIRPKWAISLSLLLFRKCHVVVYQEASSRNINSMATKICGVVLGILAVPLVSIRSVLSIPIFLLSPGDLLEAASALILVVYAPLRQIGVFLQGFHNQHYQHYYAAQSSTYQGSYTWNSSPITTLAVDCGFTRSVYRKT